MNRIFDRKLLAVAIASASLLTACGGDSDDNDGPAAAAPAPRLTRVATVPLGAEVTGMELSENGDFFFNVQHPSDSLPPEEAKAAVGVVTGVDYAALPGGLEELPVPEGTSAEAMTTRVALGNYLVLGREGNDYAGALPFGLGHIVDATGTASLKQSPNPDFNAFIPANAEATEGYLFTAWEDRPGAMSRLQLTRADDTWLVEDALNVDFSAVGGTMINCFGSVSPWGTPLTAEENYEAENTAHWNDPSYSGGYPNFPDVQLIQDYLGGTFPNPYDYGYIVEITQPTAADPVPIKHFTLGRMAHENPVVMPDRKTVYLTDDGGNKAFFKFVATTAGDLSSGTLYAAKLTQDSDTDSATTGFDVTWVELGSGDNATIETWVDEYDGVDETDYVNGDTSYISAQDVADYAAGTAPDDRVAFLESLRAAEAKGATVEFNKMEGIRINDPGAADGTVPYMYVAMSDVTGAMTDGTGDIAVTANRCGILYRFPLEPDYDVARMEPVLAGGPYDSGAAQNQCAVDGISNPDNVLVLDDGRVLVGEDTGRHSNNMIWLFDPKGA